MSETCIGGNPATVKKVRSNNVKFLIQLGGDPSTVVVLKGQRDLTVNETASTTEVSDKDSNSYAEYLYALLDGTMNVTGVIIADDITLQAVRDARKNKCEIIAFEEATLQDGSVRVDQGWVLVTSISRTAAKDDVWQYAIDLQMNGPFEAVPVAGVS